MIIAPQLKGFSGCSLNICKNNGEYFVRKISKNIQYNKRFEIQLKKQMYFYKMSDSLNMRQKTPSVISSFHTEDGLLACDMSYINGFSVIECSKNNRNNVIENIFSFLMKEINIDSYEQPGQAFSEALQDKIHSLIALCAFDAKLQGRFVEATKQVVRNLDLTPTFCHGDFTLENMIVVDDTIYLIDFLDSFYPHYWFDIAKLYQEIEGDWQRIKNYHNETILSIETDLKKDFDSLLIENLKEYPKYHYYFLALTFARIIPYSSDHKITCRLYNNVEKYIANFLNQVKLGESV